MASIRRALVLSILDKYKPAKLLEVGCGNHSVFNNYRCELMYLVEPSAKFAHVALQEKFKENVTLLNRFIEDVEEELREKEFDFILVSGLLHEVQDTTKLLKTVVNIMNPSCTLHLNVPNARSLHRLLAYEMGLIKNIFERSETQKRMQQPHTFDLDTLSRLVADFGLKVIESGSYFIKPFTHYQLQKLLDEKIISMSTIEGLSKIEKYLPGLGAEIYINAKIQ